MNHHQFLRILREISVWDNSINFHITFRNPTLRNLPLILSPILSHRFTTSARTISGTWSKSSPVHPVTATNPNRLQPLASTASARRRFHRFSATFRRLTPSPQRLRRLYRRFPASTRSPLSRRTCGFWGTRCRRLLRSRSFRYRFRRSLSDAWIRFLTFPCHRLCRFWAEIFETCVCCVELL